MYARRIEDLGFVSQEQRRKDRKGLYKVIPAEKLSQRELGLHLCEAGPYNCTICGACAYGLEYLRRCEAMTGMTQREIIEKYHATSADVSIAVRGMKPIGERPGTKRSAKVYDEKTVVRNLAGVWRGRANNHIRMAQEWQAKADLAERLGIRE